MEEKGKKLGTLNIVAMGIGGAIGTGIFIMLGFGIAYTGRSIVLVCGAGCIYMLLAYWYYMAFSSMFTLPGGDYDVRCMIFPPVLTGVAAWFQVVTSLVLAGHSLAIADFAAMIWPKINDFKSLFAICVLTLTFLCTIRGSRVLTLIQNYVVVALIIALILFLVYGMPQVNTDIFLSNKDGGFFHGGFGGFISALSVMSFACTGTAAKISMTAVTKNPKRTLPIASILTTVVVAVIYSLMAFVAGGVLPYDQIAGANISVTAEAIMPRWGFLFFVVGGGIFAVSTTMLSVLANLRYPILRVAEDGWIPKAFMKTTKGGYPWVIYVVLYAVSLVPLVTGLDIEGIVANAMVPMMLFTIATNLYCLKLPQKYPQQWEKRGIRFPLWLWNVFSVVGSILALIVAYTQFSNMDTNAMVVCVVVIAALFGLSILSLKKKWVTPEELNRQKQAIIEKAIADDPD